MNLGGTQFSPEQFFTKVNRNKNSLSNFRAKKCSALLFLSGKGLWVSLITNRFICFPPGEAVDFAMPTL